MKRSAFLRRAPLIIVSQQWHHILIRSWPMSLITAEWLEEKQDFLFHVLNDAGARMLGFRDAAQVAGRTTLELGWSRDDVNGWYRELQSAEDGEFLVIEKDTVMPTGSKNYRRCSVRPQVWVAWLSLTALSFRVSAIVTLRVGRACASSTPLKTSPSSAPASSSSAVGISSSRGRHWGTVSPEVRQESNATNVCVLRVCCVCV